MADKSLNEIRSTFLKYFEKNDHKIVESSNLVPNNDPTKYFREYWIPFMKSLNINLCFMQDKKIVWYKDFKDNDPFL